MNNDILREIEKAFVSTMMEPTTSLQCSLQKVGPSLQEATLEGATSLEAKSRQKRFIPFLPMFLKALIEESLPYKSEEAQAEVQKNSHSFLDLAFLVSFSSPAGHYQNNTFWQIKRERRASVRSC